MEGEREDISKDVLEDIIFGRVSDNVGRWVFLYGFVLARELSLR